MKAVSNLTNLVLRGVPVVIDVVFNRAGIGANQNRGRTPTSLSHVRHPSPRYPRFWPADTTAGKTTADRAGRPESGLGVPDSRSRARRARWAILQRWSPAAGGPSLTVAECFGLVPLAKPTAPVGMVLRESPHTFRTWFPAAGHRLRRPCFTEPGMRLKGGRARFEPVQGIPAASTRGAAVR
jgi:hypothetical protein